MNINILKKITKQKEFGILLIIIILSAILSFLSDAFLKIDNVLDFMRSYAVLGIMAFGMLPVIISGGIDLSVSSSIALSAVVIGKILTTFPSINLFIVIFVSMITGGIIGAINGLIITKIKIPPIVVTLGTMTIVLGAVLLYTGGIWITGLPEWWKDFGRLQIGKFQNFYGGTTGISIQVIILIIVGIIVHIMLKYTLIGRGIYACGGSESSAIRVGYNIYQVILYIYIFCGMITGIAAFTHISIVGQVDPNTYNGYELDVVAIVVLGGANTTGGYGTVFGTSLGIIMMAILKNGLILAKVPTYWQKVVVGIIIVIAVSVDVINRKREQAKLVHVDIEE